MGKSNKETDPLLNKTADIPQNEKELPFSRVNVFSVLSKWWIVGLILKIYRGQFNPDTDIWACAVEDQSKNTSKRLMDLWRTAIEKNGTKASLFWVLCKSEWRAVACLLAWLTLFTLSSFLLPTVCTHSVLSFAGGPSGDISTGLQLFSMFVGVLLLEVLSVNALVTYGQFLGARLRGMITGLLYRKLINLKKTDPEVKAQLITAMLTDVERVEHAVDSIRIFSVPPYTILTLVYMAIVVGPVSLVPYAVYISNMLVTVPIGKVISRFRKKTAEIADKRIQTINEILSNMKTVKVYCLEKVFSKTVNDVRNLELGGIRKLLALTSFATTSKGNFDVALTILAIFSLLMAKGWMTPPEIFTILAATLPFSVMLIFLPSWVKQLADLHVALKRIEVILQMEEFVPVKALSQGIDRGDIAIRLSSVQLHKAHASAENAGNAMAMVEHEYKPATGCEKTQEVGSPETEEIAKDRHVEANKISRRKNSTSVTPVGATTFEFTIKKGTLVGLCGQIGTGKTTLINTIISRFQGESGEVLVNGTMAYVPQESWITSATFRENIVMGNSFDQGRYDQVLKNCCLLKDVSLLSNGDQTEIGERGVNLSGGQKQRVSLARALYSNRDIYLLDDPLSALDACVANEIFTQCIMGLLMKGKTTLLVTHQAQEMAEVYSDTLGQEKFSVSKEFFGLFLSVCDSVLFLSHTDSPIMSSHAELLKDNESYRKMISSAQYGDKSQTVSSPERQMPRDEIPVFTRNGQTPHVNHSAPEDSDPIRVTWSSVLTYMGYAGRKIPLTVGMVFITCLSSLVILFPWVWTTVCFASVPQKENCTANCEIITYQEVDTYFTAILLLTLSASLLSTMASTAAMTMIAGKASRNLHARLFSRFMRGTLTFFETAPIGAIQNCFSSDMDTVDNSLPFDLEKAGIVFSRITVSLLALVFVWPLEGVIIIICALLIYAIGSVVLMAMNVLQKLEKTAKSPICTLASSTIDGLSSILVYDKAQNFQNVFFELVDRHCVMKICTASVGHFSFFWIGLVCRVPIVSVVVALTLLPYTGTEFNLLLTLSLLVMMIVPYANMHMNQASSHLASVERIHRFIQETPQENTAHDKSVKSLENWPMFGEIAFRNVVLRYKPTIPPALNHVTFHVKAREKIGVVGRSGAGKSSIVCALLRLVALDEGSVIIDDVDISNIALSELRSKVFVLPQDPAIFTGTIRSNLDPLEEKGDLELWEALTACHLLHKVRTLPGGLSHNVLEGNSTLSMGEKQLMCLARAVLQRSQIMLLDEATASVDPHTDSLIQDTLRTVFARSTMLIVAHRLKSVMHCDRVMVISEGQVMEFDSPNNLLKYNSHFKRLWESSENKHDD